MIVLHPYYELRLCEENEAVLKGETVFCREPGWGANRTRQCLVLSLLNPTSASVSWEGLGADCQHSAEVI